MTPAEWRRFASPIVGENWGFSKRLAYWRPVDWVVYGILAEGSSSGGFYLWDVRIPLYESRTVINLSWSRRVGGGSKRWEMDAAAAQAIAETQRSIAAAVEAADSVLITTPLNLGMQETWAYGLVLEGKIAAAVEVLGRVCRYEAEYEWERIMVARATEMRELLLADRVPDVLDRISGWRTATARSIGIRLG